MSDDLVKRLREAGHDDRKSTGALYLEAADALERQIPEGWKLVPVKPTEKMKVAGNDTGLFEDDYPRDSREAAAQVWRYMLNASSPPAKRD